MRKLYVLVLLLLISCSAAKETEPTPLTASWFEKPLIAGASISADFKTKSPGKRLAERFTDAAKITTVAQSGAPALQIEPRITSELLSSHTLLIAMDLFFWDSTQGDPAPSLAALDRLLEKAEQAGIPLILGDIPALIPIGQSSRSALNRALREKCVRAQQCYLLPLDSIHRTLIEEGSISFEGAKYTLREVMPDGLHLSDVGARYLADRMAALLQSPAP
jgi:hypothetical protein